MSAFSLIPLWESIPREWLFVKNGHMIAFFLMSLILIFGFEKEKLKGIETYHD